MAYFESARQELFRRLQNLEAREVGREPDFLPSQEDAPAPEAQPTISVEELDQRIRKEIRHDFKSTY
jgi:hypothetical protein